MIISVEIVNGPNFVRNFLTTSLNVSTVCPRFMLFSTSLLPLWTGTCKNRKTLLFSNDLSKLSLILGINMGFIIPTLILKFSGICTTWSISEDKSSPISKP